MCGIVCYLGKREVLDILLKGLQRLEYRCVARLPTAFCRLTLRPRLPQGLRLRWGWLH